MEEDLSGSQQQVPRSWARVPGSHFGVLVQLSFLSLTALKIFFYTVTLHGVLWYNCKLTVLRTWSAPGELNFLQRSI